MNGLAYLRPTTPPADVICPKCEQAHDIDWETDDGSPYSGKHEVVCMNCLYGFTIRVTVITIIKVEDTNG